MNAYAYARNSRRNIEREVCTFSVTPEAPYTTRIVENTTCAPVIAAVVCLGRDNLTEPIPLQACFEFGVFLLLDALPLEGRRHESVRLFNSDELRRNGFIPSPVVFEQK